MIHALLIHASLTAFGSKARHTDRSACRTGMLALSMALGLATGGCSWSLPMFSFEKADKAEPAQVIATSSLGPAKANSPLSADLGIEDWRRAAGAMALALDPQGNGAEVSWSNPESGMKGTFHPVSGPVLRGDDVCRAFLTTLVLQTSTRKLQGMACRPSGGQWSIKDLTLWKG